VNDALRILILETLASDAELLERELQRSQIPFTARQVASRAEYLKGLEDFAPDVILADYKLADIDGTEALRWAQERVPQAPFIIVTGSINEETAVECMKAGAADSVLQEQIGRI